MRADILFVLLGFVVYGDAHTRVVIPGLANVASDPVVRLLLFTMLALVFLNTSINVGRHVFGLGEGLGVTSDLEVFLLCFTYLTCLP